jgi:predicted transporter
MAMALVMALALVMAMALVSKSPESLDKEEVGQMKNSTVNIILILAVLLIILAGIWQYYQWKECREMGFSIFYCIQHIS